VVEKLISNTALVIGLKYTTPLNVTVSIHYYTTTVFHYASPSNRTITDISREVQFDNQFTKMLQTGYTALKSSKLVSCYNVTHNLLLRNNVVLSSAVKYGANKLI